MANIRFLYFYIFNIMCTFVIMPMENSLVRVNGTVSCSNGSTVNNVSLCTQRNIPYHVKPLGQTKTKKTVMSPSQERNNILLNEIRDKIDREHLQINLDDVFRPMIGTFWSLHKVAGLARSQAIDELAKIQSYITVKDKEYIFQKLEKKHGYVIALFDLAVDTKVKELEKIKGSTIDILLYLPKQNGFKRMVHRRALEQYYSTLSTRQWFSLHGRNSFENFHAIVLYGNGYFKIDADSLAMSSDSKYLRAIDLDSNEMIWDIEQEILIDLFDRDIANIEWIYSRWSFGKGKYYVSDNDDRYTAALVDEQDVSDAIYLANSGTVHQTKNLGGWAFKAIMLDKKPQKEAWFVQTALDNSVTKEELVALLHSKTLAAIKGFPKENFEKYITSKINKL